MSPLEKLIRIPTGKVKRVHMLTFNNLFNFGLENFTKMKRPAKLVKPATVYLCLASVFQSHLIFNRIERPLNLFMKKNCKAPKQQPFFSGNTSLLCQAWNHLGEHVPLNCFYPLSLSAILPLQCLDFCIVAFACYHDQKTFLEQIEYWR